jgi:hypothetical protein
MAHLSKKQRQERLMEEFLRRIRKASPGERVYTAVGDLFEAAEVHDLNEVRTARRAAADPGGGDEGRTAVEFWSETLRALKLATSVVAVRCAAMASKAMAHLDLTLRLCRRQVYRSGRIRPPGGAAASGFFRRSPNLRGQPSARWTD